MSRALLVGINYRSTANELKGCLQDVQLIRDMLISKYKYSPSNITVLTDDTPIKPTRDNIIRSLTDLCSYSGQTYFHYSGHGIVNSNGGGGTTRQVEMICPLDFATNGMIYDYQFRNIVSTVGEDSNLSGTVDSCHSENLFNLAHNFEIDNNGHTVLTQVGAIPETKGNVTVLSATRTSQSDLDKVINGRDDGALTAALIKILDGSPISCHDLLVRVNQFYINQENNSSQNPCLSFGKYKPLSTPFLL